MIKLLFKVFFGLLLVGFVFGSIYFSQCFMVDSDSLPKVYLYRWRSIPFNHKATTFMSYISNDSAIEHIYLQKIRAKARGGFSEDFPKHNFTIKLANEHRLGGLKKEDDWILGASYIEKSFIRHKLSFDLFKSFNAEYKSPQCEFIEVYRNIRYHGLYVLMERMDSKRLGVNKNDSAACIFKEPPVFVDPTIIVNSNPRKKNDFYHQKFPDVVAKNKSEELKKLREFIVDAPDSIFNNSIASFFDLDHIIDWHILLLVTHNSDAIVKGFYLYRTENRTPFKIALWDYNHSFGRDNDNEPHLPGIINWKRNTLLNRLVNSNTNDYKTRLKNRFIELKEAEVLTSANLLSMIDNDYLKIKRFAKRNEKKWSVNAKPFYDNANFEYEIISIKKWIPLQLDEVEEYLDKLESR